MKSQILKSYCKINLFLNVGRKLKRYKLHNIQSLIFFISLYDQIQIEKINSFKDNIKFFGKFSNYVNKKNNSINFVPSRKIQEMSFQVKKFTKFRTKSKN